MAVDNYNENTAVENILKKMVQLFNRSLLNPTDQMPQENTSVDSNNNDKV